MKKIIIAGATGMVGGELLSLALANNQIGEIVSLVRKKTSQNHAKVTEVVVKNFEDYSAHAKLFTNVSAAYFCIGVYAGPSKR